MTSTMAMVPHIPKTNTDPPNHEGGNTELAAYWGNTVNDSGTQKLEMAQGLSDWNQSESCVTPVDIQDIR